MSRREFLKSTTALSSLPLMALVGRWGVFKAPEDIFSPYPSFYPTMAYRLQHEHA